MTDATTQGNQATLWWVFSVNGRELKRVRVGENMRKGVSMMAVWQVVTPERFAWLLSGCGVLSCSDGWIGSSRERKGTHGRMG